MIAFDLVVVLILIKCFVSYASEKEMQNYMHPFFSVYYKCIFPHFGNFCVIFVVHSKQVQLFFFIKS